MKMALKSLDDTFDDISGKIIVMKCDVTSAICNKLLSLFNIMPENAQDHPFLGIVDLSISDENMLKYQPEIEMT